MKTGDDEEISPFAVLRQLLACGIVRYLAGHAHIKHQADVELDAPFFHDASGRSILAHRVAREVKAVRVAPVRLRFKTMAHHAHTVELQARSGAQLALQRRHALQPSGRRDTRHHVNNPALAEGGHPPLLRRHYGFSLGELLLFLLLQIVLAIGFSLIFGVALLLLGQGWVFTRAARLAG